MPVEMTAEMLRASRSAPRTVAEAQVAALHDRLDEHSKHDEERHSELVAQLAWVERRLWALAVAAAGAGATVAHWFNL